MYVHIAIPDTGGKYAMTYIVASVDVSGNPSSGNHKFMGIVMGTREKIDFIFSHMGPNHIHMSMIRNKDTR